MDITTMKTRLGLHGRKAEALMATAEREGRALTDAEKADLAATEKEMDTLASKIEKAEADASFKDSLDRATGGRISATGVSLGPSFGDQIKQSPFGQFLASHKGKLVRGGPAWDTPTLSLLGFGGGDRLKATTITEDPASGGSLTIPEYVPGVVPLPTRKLVVADLFGQGVATSNAVVFMAESSIVNAAHETAEGGVKPESEIVFTGTNEPVRKIAHYIPVTEEILEDVPNFPNYLNGRLRDFVLLAEDNSLINGDGVAPHLTGILHRAGLAAPIARVDPQNNADAILAQIMAIETSTQLAVTGIVMNPANYLPMYGLKNLQGSYLSAGPFAPLDTPTLWGVPVALTPAIALGTALVGAFRTGAELRRRTPVEIRASNSHIDFFIKNLIAIVAEERLALVVYRPSAFGEVTGLL